MASSEFGDSSRRTFLRHAALAGGLIALPSSLTACATSGGGGNEPGKTGTQSSDNPLGIDVAAPLEVVMFAGGLKTELPDVQKTYTAKYPQAKIGLSSTTDIKSLQPRFAGGNPPDVVNDSGAGQIPLSGLAGNSQLADLAALMDAPSVSDPSKKVRDTIFDGVIDTGSFDGKMFSLNYVYSSWAIWYSKTLFDKNGWKIPTDWSDLLKLCEQIKQAGIAPTCYGGTNAPTYITRMMITMAAKSAGKDFLIRMDNLDPDVWRSDAMKQAAQVIEEMARKQYFLQGSPGMKHTEVQAELGKGKVAFYSAGSFLENEMKDQLSPDFNMVMSPVPRLSSSDKMPFEALYAGASEPFIVPSKAKNARGGMEFMRHMLSVDNALAFSQLTNNLTIVKEANQKFQTKSSALNSVKDALKKADTNTFTFLLYDWYGAMKKDTGAATSDLMTGRINADGFVNACAAAADRVKKDSATPKFTRK